MTIIAKIGSKMNRRITITDTEIIDRYHHSFKVIEDRYPIAGAHAEVADTISGWRNQLHQYSVIIKFMDGRQIVYIYTTKGSIGRIEVARMTRFAANINRVAAFAGKVSL
jgi:hypothetical protein